MTGTLLSLGSINADFQVRVDAPPGEAETLQAHQFSRLPGGKAGNTAYLGALFGLDSHLLGRVGDDELARQALAPLREAGVLLDGVTCSRNESTAVSMITVPPDGKKQIVLAGNANEDWDEDAIARMLSRIVEAPRPCYLVADYEIPREVVDRALACAIEHQVPVVLDPSFAERIDLARLEGIAAITPNVEEATTLVGSKVETPEQAADAALLLRRHGVGLACVKLSDGGAVVAGADGVFHVPSAKMEVVDSTGAGDAFTGVLAIALLKGLAPLDAVAWAVAASDLAVTGYGSQPAYAAPERVEEHARQRRAQARPLRD